MNDISFWKVSSGGEQVIREEKKIHRLKHGMTASIPLVCKKEHCPFIGTCRISKEDRDANSRCLMEIAAILQRFESLCKFFKINDKEDTINEEDIVDVSLIKDIVDYEIQILRVENLIAKNGDFMAEHIAQVDKFGEAYYEDIIHPALEYKIKILDQRNKTYSKLVATRKDKLDVQKKGNEGYTKHAIAIIEKVKAKVKDIDLDEFDSKEEEGV